MAILDATTAKIWAPEHVILIGKTKSGKSRWAVETVRDGYETIYIDTDNGLQTIRDNLSNDQDALNRLHYFNPRHMASFVVSLLTENVFRYNETRQQEYNRASDAQTDRIAEIRPALIPQRVMMVIDSWTTLTFSLIQAQAQKLQIDLTDIDKYSREIYGGAGHKATQIASIMQTLRFSTIVIAHAADYERKEKPKGSVRDVNEKDMIIKEVVQVPASTSLPHGHSIGKFFSQIGNMYVKPGLNSRVLSFKIEADKISGGSPNAEGDPMKEFRYATLFGKPPAKAEDEKQWIRYTTVEEIQSAAKAAAGNPSTPQPKVIQQNPGAVIPVLPGKSPDAVAMAAMLGKK